MTGRKIHPRPGNNYLAVQGEYMGIEESERHMNKLKSCLSCQSQNDTGRREPGALSWKPTPALYIHSEPVPQMPWKPSGIAPLAQGGGKTEFNGRPGSSLAGWEHLPKFINCLLLPHQTSKDFLLYLNTKGYFPILGRFTTLFFIFYSEYVFDTSLVIRIAAWHCRKQKMFACIMFHIINGSYSLPCKLAPWIILQYAVENCSKSFASKSAFLTANSLCFVNHYIYGIKSNKKIKTWSSYGWSLKKYCFKYRNQTSGNFWAVSSTKALRCTAEHAKHLRFCCISGICSKIYWSVAVFLSVLGCWRRFSFWKQQLRKVSACFSDFDGILVLLTLRALNIKEKMKHLIWQITRNT